MTNNNNHPYLQWNPYHENNILGYYLYRKTNFTNGSSNIVKFSVNPTSFLDTQIQLNESIDVFTTYWVKARLKNSNTESLAGNSVTTKGKFNPQKLNGSKKNVNLASYYLYANYPNPFNPSTTITYQIPKKGHVLLRIYNTLGKEVGTLVNENKEAGNYTVNFNAKNLPSGLYFYRIAIHSDKLTTGEYTKVRKMILIK